MAFDGLSLHPNFRSIALPIESMEDLMSCFDVNDFPEVRTGRDLFSKRDFRRNIGRMKVEKWNLIDTSDFRIDFRKIDRFYIHDHGFGDDAELITNFRMDLNGMSVFINLKLRLEDCRGALFFTYDPEIFLRVTVQWQDATMKVWLSLLEDGHDLKPPQEYEYRAPCDCSVVPPLKHLCNLKISNGIRRGTGLFSNYTSVLPMSLVLDVKRYIELWEVEFDYFESIGSLTYDSESYSDSSSFDTSDSDGPM